MGYRYEVSLREFGDDPKDGEFLLLYMYTTLPGQRLCAWCILTKNEPPSDMMFGAFDNFDTLHPAPVSTVHELLHRRLLMAHAIKQRNSLLGCMALLGAGLDGYMIHFPHSTEQVWAGADNLAVAGWGGCTGLHNGPEPVWMIKLVRDVLELIDQEKFNQSSLGHGEKSLISALLLKDKYVEYRYADHAIHQSGELILTHRGRAFLELTRDALAEIRAKQEEDTK